MGDHNELSSQSVTVSIVGGPTFTIPFAAHMNAQQAMEEAFDQNSSAFTYVLQYYGKSLGNLVLMINETYETFNSGGTSLSPFYYWEFLINGTPASTGIDQAILKPGDAVSFSFIAYDAGSASPQLRAKHARRLARAAAALK